MLSWLFQSGCNWICTSPKTIAYVQLVFWFSLIGFVIDCNHNILALLICTLYTNYFWKLNWIELNWILSRKIRNKYNLMDLIDVDPSTRNKNVFSLPLRRLLRLKIDWCTLWRWCPKWIGLDFNALSKQNTFIQTKIFMNNFNWMAYFVFVLFFSFLQIFIQHPIWCLMFDSINCMVPHRHISSFLHVYNWNEYSALIGKQHASSLIINDDHLHWSGDYLDFNSM